MRNDLKAAIAELFADALRRMPRRLTDADRDRLVDLVNLTRLCGSAVERDGYKREIELVPDSEAPTRLIKVLDRLLAGLNAMGVDRADAWRIVTKLLAGLVARHGSPTQNR